jgi:hypothetical protein
VAASSPIASPNVASPTEDNFLAVLASQERYVLELREELAKAEEDLKTVKKHWAKHQSIKLRNDARKVTQLQPLSGGGLGNMRPDPDDEDGSTLWMQREMERRKALLSGVKPSQRKVFSGSRHLRTLSLLSPDRSYAPSFPQPQDVRESESEPSTTRPQSLSLTRSSTAATSPDIANQIATTMKDDRYDLTGLSNIQRENLLRTGKQLASDFKDGLLTFIEDIKQATVGDEAGAYDDNSSSQNTSTKGTRKPSGSRPALNRAASSKKSASEQSGDIADEFWKEHGLSEPKTAPTNKKTHALKHTRTPQKPAKEEEFDEWDNWDTPADNSHDKAAAESDESDEPSSPVSGQASSRTSTRYHSKRHDSKASSLTTSSSAGPVDEASLLQDSKRNSIPWPDLVKLSPTNLKRTASHLMKEWEKNLTPPPEARDSSHASGDYIGRSVSPAGLP